MQQSYIATIVFNILCDGVFTGEYEEQLRIIYADNNELALQTAKKFGKDEASIFKDRKQRIIEWKFSGVKELKQVCLENGALIHSSITEAKPIEGLHSPFQ